HTFTDACFYEIVFSALDDDGGSASDSAIVIIAGDADLTRDSGYWMHQYKGNGKIVFTAPELQCYLEIVAFMSSVFNEERSAATFAQAHDVLFVKGNNGTMTELLDEQLLAAWLNFANGAYTLTEMVDTNGDGIDDTTFGAALATAEAVRLNPASTRAQLEAQKNILERINLGA
ncbi:MAG: hypothetical protein M3439_03365, partial [Chloroflexota bacterium]|nr:hypothetical protein [Chloroflexota bacterium]